MQHYVYTRCFIGFTLIEVGGMAKKKNAYEALGGIVLIAVGLIIWLITVVFKALGALHENLIQFGSTPIGLIVIFFGLARFG